MSATGQQSAGAGDREQRPGNPESTATCLSCVANGFRLSTLGDPCPRSRPRIPRNSQVLDGRQPSSRKNGVTGRSSSTVRPEGWSFSRPSSINIRGFCPGVSYATVNVGRRAGSSPGSSSFAGSSEGGRNGESRRRPSSSSVSGGWARGLATSRGFRRRNRSVGRGRRRQRRRL
jgi:hypothetical protein